jgi:predicted nucleotide-binding protein
MDLSRKLELLDERIKTANGGSPENFETWHDETEVVLRTVMEKESPIYERFQNVRYHPSIWTENTDFGPYQESGVQSVISLLNAAKRELELAAESDNKALAAEVEEVIEVSDKGAGESNGRVFIVHGHDEARMHELARFLRTLTGFEPVILHEQPNMGAVLIEKLETSAATTGFAVVLLTADDMGRANRETELKPRGRQNVIFEMGFFFGALRRGHVAVLLEEGIEHPSDITGLVYTPLDGRGAWKATLAREIEAAGIPVEWAALR